MTKYYDYKAVRKLKQFTPDNIVETIWKDRAIVKIKKSNQGLSIFKRQRWLYTVESQFVYKEQLYVYVEHYKTLKPALKYAQDIFQQRNRQMRVSDVWVEDYPKHPEGV